MNSQAVEKTTAEEYFKLGDVLLLQNKFKESILNFEQALVIHQKNNQWEKVVACYNKISESQWKNVQLNKALQTANKALDISSKKLGSDHLQYAIALENKGTCYRLKGSDLKISLSYYEKALKLKSKVLPNDDLEFSNSYFNLGNIYGTKGDYELALEYYDKTLGIRENKLGKNHIQIADVYEAIGRILYAVGNYDKALGYFENAYKIASQTFDKNNLYFVKIYNKIGIIHYYKKAYNKSLKYYQRAFQISIHNLGDNHPDQARLHHNLGTVYIELGQREKALYHVEKTIEIGVNTYGEGYKDLFYPYSFVAQIYGGQKGIYYAKKALDICLNNFGENHIRTSEVYSTIGLLYQEANAFDMAQKYLEKSLKIHQNIFESGNSNIVYSYNLLVDLFLSQKKYEESLVYSEKAIEANKKAYRNNDNSQLIFEDFISPVRLLNSLEKKAYSLQKIYLQKKEDTILNESIKTYNTAKKLIEVLRREYDPKDVEVLAKNTKRVYSGAIAAYLLKYEKSNDEKWIRKAFYFSESSKYNILKGLLNDEKAKTYAGLPNKLLEIEHKIKAELSALKSSLINTKDKDTINFLESKFLTISRRQDSLIKVLEAKYPKYYNLKFNYTPLVVNDIQNYLPTKTTLIEYFIEDDILYAFVITKNGITINQESISDLNKKINQFREHILSKDIEAFKKISFELYQKLIAPIKDNIEGNQLIIIPDESLWHLNFDLLLTKNLETKDPKKQPYLIKEFAISYANSASLLLDQSNQKVINTDVRKECLAFSFSNQDSLLAGDQMELKVLRNIDDDLPGTRNEIKKIAELVKGRYFFGSKAIERNFKNNLSNYNVLHLALHGEVDHQNPDNSRIYFTKTKDSLEDNVLYSHELYSLEIPAELTVLSACNTGMGKVAKGEGILSLGTAFQYAGTKSLLLTSWEVSDKTTPIIIQSFYSNLTKGMNKAIALQQAKLEYLETTDVFTKDPFYWGGFFLLGDYSTITFETPSTNNWKWFFLLGFLVIGIFFFLKRKLIR
ncbi:CHAT domain-containing protein [Aquimarina sp. 433]